MLLVVDIGNTAITLGVFDNDKIADVFRIPTDKTIGVSEYKDKLLDICSKYKITDCSIGSVVRQISPIIKEACDKAFNIDSFLLTTYENLDIKISTKNPSAVGADRVGNAFAAAKKYKLPAIVVDIGTAITFDVVSKDKEFLGGVIIPGINMQLESLNLHTAELPKVEIKMPEKAIGNSTESAILSGVINGISCSIQGLLKMCEKELGEKPTIIATGGYGEFVAKLIPESFDYINPVLTLDGLRLLYESRKDL